MALMTDADLQDNGVNAQGARTKASFSQGNGLYTKLTFD
jgi:hypothetical protein